MPKFDFADQMRGLPIGLLPIGWRRASDFDPTGPGNRGRAGR
jgi:hypothetical protein